MDNSLGHSENTEWLDTGFVVVVCLLWNTSGLLGTVFTCVRGSIFSDRVRACSLTTSSISTR